MKNIRLILSDYLRSWVLWLHRKAITRSRLVHVERVMRMRKRLSSFFNVIDVLTPLDFVYRSRGYQLRGEHSEELCGLFDSSVQMGTWAIDQRGAKLLWEWLEKERPSHIFEFGSGVSTLVIGAWIKQSCTLGTSCVSIDQNQHDAEKTNAWLKRVGLSDFVNVYHVPIDGAGKYQFDEINHITSGTKFDFVFVDGPAGPDGCRRHTLPALKSHLSDKGVWFLHDALRDGELDIVQQWQRDDIFRTKGIYVVGQGLAMGEWGAE